MFHKFNMIMGGNMSNADGFYTKVVGVSYKNPDGSSRQEIIKEYAAENKIILLIREPKNKNDTNAVAVYLEYGFLFSYKKYQIGYLDSQTASEIAPLIDAGYEVKAIISSVSGLDQPGNNIGVNLFIEMPKPDTLYSNKIIDQPNHKSDEKEVVQNEQTVQESKSTHQEEIQKMDQSNEIETEVVELKNMTDSQKITKLVQLQYEAADSLKVIAKKTSTIATIMIIGLILAILSVIIGSCS